MAGVAVLKIGNLSTQYVWAFVGLPVVEVVSSSINIIAGTNTWNINLPLHFMALILLAGFLPRCFCYVIIILNYLDDKINRAKILFPGVGMLLSPTHLGSAVQPSNAADNKTKLNKLPCIFKDKAEYSPFL